MRNRTAKFLLAHLLVLSMALTAGERTFRVEIRQCDGLFRESAYVTKKVRLSKQLESQNLVFKSFSLTPRDNVLVKNATLSHDELRFEMKNCKTFLESAEVSVLVVLKAETRYSLNTVAGRDDFSENWIDPMSTYSFSVDPDRTVKSVSVCWTDAGGDATGKLFISSHSFGKIEIGSAIDGVTDSWNINRSFSETSSNASILILKDKAKIYTVEVTYIDSPQPEKPSVRQSLAYKTEVQGRNKKKPLVQDSIVEPLQARHEPKDMAPFFPGNALALASDSPTGASEAPPKPDWIAMHSRMIQMAPDDLPAQYNPGRGVFESPDLPSGPVAVYRPEPHPSGNGSMVEFHPQPSAASMHTQYYNLARQTSEGAPSSQENSSYTPPERRQLYPPPVDIPSESPDGTIQNLHFIPSTPEAVRGYIVDPTDWSTLSEKSDW
ncbi:MAG: hypothetical protein PHQ23_14525 [Candidatus Wallbacteria bacterium]|nr:hypothetical protein [Candidatus Wallbacteria bacterium]